MKELLKKRTKVFAHNCVKITQELPNTYLSNHIKVSSLGAQLLLLRIIEPPVLLNQNQALLQKLV